MRTWVCSTFLVATCLAQTQPQSAVAPPKSDSLKRFLQRHLKGSSLGVRQATRYVAAFVDLKGDGKQEAIVYVSGRRWCGSGGCPTLILEPAGPSYRIVTKILITRPPIRVLTSTSHGWRSLGVFVQGGGIQPGYEAELRFDGKKYPSNPSVPPARRLSESAAGKVVVDPSQEGVPLFP
jgi:hypothetical protein